MSQTYTSPTLSVSDGEITSHDTTTVAEGITILSAECRWQGITTSSTTTDRTYYTDTNARTFDLVSSGNTYTIGHPTATGNTVYDYDTKLEAYDEQYGDVQWETTVNGSTRTDDSQIGGNTYKTVFTDESGTDSSGDSTTLTLNSIDAGDINDIQVDSIKVTSVVRSYTENTSTTYSDTQDPFVTRDVDGAYTGTLDDGEWSSWVTLNGLESGINEFHHNISGSGKANFQFRYTWEYNLPTAVKTYKIKTNDTTYEVRLADPSDKALDYNVYRVEIGGIGTLAYDLVDPSDPDALNQYIYHPTHGKLALRGK